MIYAVKTAGKFNPPNEFGSTLPHKMFSDFCPFCKVRLDSISLWGFTKGPRRGRLNWQILPHQAKAMVENRQR